MLYRYDHEEELGIILRNAIMHILVREGRGKHAVPEDKGGQKQGRDSHLTAASQQCCWPLMLEVVRTRLSLRTSVKDSAVPPGPQLSSENVTGWSLEL